MKDGQRIEIRVFKFVALVEDGDDPELAAYRDPCKHSVVFIEAEELQEVCLTLLTEGRGKGQPKLGRARFLWGCSLAFSVLEGNPGCFLEWSHSLIRKT